MTENNSSGQTVIFPQYDWTDGEVIGGNGKWTCPCGQPNFFEVMDIYDVVKCSLCEKRYEMSLKVYLQPYNSSSTTNKEKNPMEKAIERMKNRT